MWFRSSKKQKSNDETEIYTHNIHRSTIKRKYKLSDIEIDNHLNSHSEFYNEIDVIKIYHKIIAELPDIDKRKVSYIKKQTKIDEQLELRKTIEYRETLIIDLLDTFIKKLVMIYNFKKDDEIQRQITKYATDINLPILDATNGILSIIDSKINDIIKEQMTTSLLSTLSNINKNIDRNFLIDDPIYHKYINHKLSLNKTIMFLSNHYKLKEELDKNYYDHEDLYKRILSDQQHTYYKKYINNNITIEQYINVIDKIYDIADAISPWDHEFKTFALTNNISNYQRRYLNGILYKFIHDNTKHELVITNYSGNEKSYMYSLQNIINVRYVKPLKTKKCKKSKHAILRKCIK